MEVTHPNRTTQIDYELRQKGHRLTLRRLMVVQVLAERGDHLTVDAILSAVQERYPSTNKTTVYRTLELLNELGFVVITDLGSGRLEFELAGHPHHHLICERCSARTEVEDRFLEPLRESLFRQYGFSTNLHHFALFGTCPKCTGQPV